MNRKEKTKFLSELVKLKIGPRGYYASEVSLDYGTSDVKRVDFMEFQPAGVTAVSAIEKGIFICYEVKSCKEDVYSGNGLNFVGEKNYIVTTMECYKDIMDDYRSGKLDQHIEKCAPGSSRHYGIMVAIPQFSDPDDEFQNPTPLDCSKSWQLATIQQCRIGLRKRSITELLFYMLRSGQ